MICSDYGCISLFVLNFVAGSMYHSNIKILDLSHNNISIIYPGYFRPAESSLTHLHLGYNALMVCTYSVVWLKLIIKLSKKII